MAQLLSKSARKNIEKTGGINLLMWFLSIRMIPPIVGAIPLFIIFSKFLSNKGIIAVHDIKNKEYPGVKKAWNEFKSVKKFKFKEIFCDDYLFYYSSSPHSLTCNQY